MQGDKAGLKEEVSAKILCTLRGEKKECWNKIAKFDIKLINFLQGNTAIPGGYFFYPIEVIYISTEQKSYLYFNSFDTVLSNFTELYMSGL